MCSGKLIIVNEIVSLRSNLWIIMPTVPSVLWIGPLLCVPGFKTRHVTCVCIPIEQLAMFPCNGQGAYLGDTRHLFWLIQNQTEKLLEKNSEMQENTIWYVYFNHWGQCFLLFSADENFPRDCLNLQLHLSRLFLKHDPWTQLQMVKSQNGKLSRYFILWFSTCVCLWQQQVGAISWNDRPHLVDSTKQTKLSTYFVILHVFVRFQLVAAVLLVV